MLVLADLSRPLVEHLLDGQHDRRADVHESISTQVQQRQEVERDDKDGLALAALLKFELHAFHELVDDVTVHIGLIDALRMQQANDVVSSVQLSQTLRDYLVFNLDLLPRDVVTFFVLDEVVADLHVLCDHEVLLFKNLVLLSRLQLNYRVLYLCRKVAENEVV